MHQPAPPRDMTRRTIRASASLLAGVAYSRAANLLMTVILARLLVPHDFGLVALGTSLLTILLAITDLSLANALIHRQDAEAADYDTAFTLGAIRGAILALTMIGGGAAMAQIYGDGRLFAICAGLAIRPLLSGLTSPYYIGYAKELRFGVVARTESIDFTAQLVVAVAVALLTQSYWAIVAGAVAASVADIIAAYWVAPYRPRLTLGRWKRILSFSVWVTLTQTISVVGMRFDNFVAGGVLGIARFGAYSVGNNMSAMVTQSAVVPLERVLFPGFAKIADDRARLAAAFQKAQTCLIAIGLPVGVGFALTAEPFVYLVLGPRWGIAALVIECIAPVLGLQMLFGPSTALAFALGETRRLFNRNLVMLAVRVPIVLAGLLLFGLPGLLAARIVSGTIMSLLNMLLVKALIGVGALAQIRVAWRSLVSGAVMAAAVLALRGVLPPLADPGRAALWLAMMIPAGALAYGLAHFGLWLASGRPQGGIEHEIAAMAGRLRARFAPGATEAAGTRG